MKKQINLVFVLILLLVPACTTAPASTPTAIPTPTPVPPPTITPTATIPPPAAGDFPFSQPGPYHPGSRTYTFADESRGGREVKLTVWYPAILPEGANPAVTTRDGEPDPAAAPCPLLLNSAKMGRIFGAHMASHGFVVAGVENIDSSDRWDTWLVDYPLDLLFALNQAEDFNGLEGVVDANHAGAFGYSFDGYDALALGGARIDPDFYLAQCAGAANMETPPPAWWVTYICANPASNWDAFTAHAGAALTASSDGLWQPMTDPRILAVMPMAPEGAWLFGERGLAAANRPTLIIDGTADDINYYNLEAAWIYNHLGTPDRILISFVGQDHMMIFNTEQTARMKHFAVAFFGFYLQGRSDYAPYFDRDFIALQDGLAWGVVE